MFDNYSTRLNRIKTGFLILGTVFFIWFWFSLPAPLFDKPFSIVVEAEDGQLLGAKIAADEQWRFPPTDLVPKKFEIALLTFEDKRFYSHFGVDIRAIGRALSQNVKAKKIVSGGSTISMQVIRLSNNQKKRTLFRKLIEMIKAVRLEIKYHKKEILHLYASNAPFGGNVVGLDAASWRYFGKKSDQLSWAESVTLAILPNSPALIHPGRNRLSLKRKRNRLLKRLFKNKIIDSLNYQLALDEPLPDKPYPIPQLAPHLVQKLAMDDDESYLKKTSINVDLQIAVNNIAQRNCNILKNNEIHNLAVMVIDVDTKKVLAYVGNEKTTGFQHASSVDIIQSPRSSGSILKPLLYALMLQEGAILPNTLISDIPTYLSGFRPENFSKTYDGVIPANTALSRSLNIPFVKMLQQYGVEKFHYNLKKHGVTTLTNGPNHYGLSLVLGGAETTLWDLTTIYASMGKRLKDFYKNNGRYDENDFNKASIRRYSTADKQKSQLRENTAFLNASATWLTFEAMRNLERPNQEGDWQRFENVKNIAWKTGTSYGFRDAWAIGVSPNHCVGVWVGNADGEGRPGITGVKAAAPILFEVFGLFPSTDWFDQPFDEMHLLETCKSSGNIAKHGCPVDSQWVTKNYQTASPCSNHQLFFLDQSEKWLVNKNCSITSLQEPKERFWFILPPVEAHYYSPKHPDYQPLPALHPSCPSNTNTSQKIQLIYPPLKAKLLVPVELDGKKGKAVFKAVHENKNSTLHWHIDREYIGSTKEIHEVEVSPNIGMHNLTVVDEQGNAVSQSFEILSKGE
ncbi:MAG: penicillin-binding protein 1C [Bacteroidota bacterium]